MTVIGNPSHYEGMYKCNQVMMEYLTYECKIPMFGYDTNYYYFVRSEELEKKLKEMSLILKLKNLWNK